MNKEMSSSIQHLRKVLFGAVEEVSGQAEGINWEKVNEEVSFAKILVERIMREVSQNGH